METLLIIGVVFLTLVVLSLIKEFFSMIARGIIRGIRKIISGIFSTLWKIVSFVFRIIISPFAFLWGFITSR